MPTIENKQIQFTAENVRDMFGVANYQEWWVALKSSCDKYGITDLYSLAVYFGIVSIECGYLQQLFVRTTPEGALKIYGLRYGNTTPEDAYKYLARGCLQLSFKSNYIDFSRDNGVDAVSNPDLLIQPTYAALSGAWFFARHGCLPYAKSGTDSGFYRCNRIIYGSDNDPNKQKKYNNYQKYLCILSGGTNCGSVVNQTVPSPNSLERKPTPYAKTPVLNESSLSITDSEYPYNMVFESRSGHVIEIDDYPGNERINIYHRSGSYFSIDYLGNISQKSVRDKSEFIQGDFSQSIDGNKTEKITGDTFITTDGETSIRSTQGIFLDSPQRVQVNTPTLATSDTFVAPIGDITDLSSTKIATSELGAESSIVCLGTTSTNNLNAVLATTLTLMAQLIITEDLQYSNGLNITDSLISAYSGG